MIMNNYKTTEIPNCRKGKGEPLLHNVLVTALFIYFFAYLTFTINYSFSSLCLVTEVFFSKFYKHVHNLYTVNCFIFSDLLTIDEKLFSSNCPPLDALPLYLSHFQFIESSEDKVK